MIHYEDKLVSLQLTVTLCWRQPGNLMETFKILNNFKKLTSELATYIYQSGNCFQQEAIHSNSPKTDAILKSLKALLYKMSNKSLKLTTQLYFYVASYIIYINFFKTKSTCSYTELYNCWPCREATTHSMSCSLEGNREL